MSCKIERDRERERERERNRERNRERGPDGRLWAPGNMTQEHMV